MEKGKRDREAQTHGQTGRQRDEPEEGKQTRRPERRAREGKACRGGQ
jgi:hypothetical protein